MKQNRLDQLEENIFRFVKAVRITTTKIEEIISSVVERVDRLEKRIDEAIEAEAKEDPPSKG